MAFEIAASVINSEIPAASAIPHLPLQGIRQKVQCASPKAIWPADAIALPLWISGSKLDCCRLERIALEDLL
jgi:hypothetical protein